MNHTKSCNCNKKACDYLLVVTIARIGTEADVITEESCNKIQLLANKDQCYLQELASGFVQAEVYKRIKE